MTEVKLYSTAICPSKYRSLLEFSAEQACRNRDVIAQLGRHPHRK